MKVKEIANKIVESERMDSEYANVNLNYEEIRKKTGLTTEEMEGLIDEIFNNEHVAECTLEDDRGFGKVIYITFWTNSCPQYIQED